VFIVVYGRLQFCFSDPCGDVGNFEFVLVGQL